MACRKHKVRAGKYVRFSDERLWNDMGLARLAQRTASLPWAKHDLVREPGAGKPHARLCVQQSWRVQRGQTRRGKSQNPVVWMARRKETNALKPIDTAIVKGGRRVTGP